MLQPVREYNKHLASPVSLDRTRQGKSHRNGVPGRFPFLRDNTCPEFFCICNRKHPGNIIYNNFHLQGYIADGNKLENVTQYAD